MKTKRILILYAGLMICGCRNNATIIPVGFLSDYSKLEQVSATSYRYIATGNRLKQYSKFLVDPVVLDWHEGSRIPGQLEAGKVTQAEMVELGNYLHRAVVSSLAERYPIVQQAGPGVAKVRVALTDVQSATPRLGDNPRVGAGTGQAAMEAEVLDSVTGEQIGAIMEISRGGSYGLRILEDWSQPKAVMKQWARRFRRYLDDAHAR